MISILDYYIDTRYNNITLINTSWEKNASVNGSSTALILIRPDKETRIDKDERRRIHRNVTYDIIEPSWLPGL